MFGAEGIKVLRDIDGKVELRKFQLFGIKTEKLARYFISDGSTKVDPII